MRALAISGGFAKIIGVSARSFSKAGSGAASAMSIKLKAPLRLAARRVAFCLERFDTDPGGAAKPVDGSEHSGNCKGLVRFKVYVRLGQARRDRAPDEGFAALQDHQVKFSVSRCREVTDGRLLRRSAAVQQTQV